MKEIKLKDRLRYGFDKSMAAGPIALIGWLALLSLIVVIIAAFVVALNKTKAVVFHLAKRLG